MNFKLQPPNSFAFRPQDRSRYWHGMQRPSCSQTRCYNLAAFLLLQPAPWVVFNTWLANNSGHNACLRATVRSQAPYTVCLHLQGTMPIGRSTGCAAHLLQHVFREVLLLVHRQNGSLDLLVREFQPGRRRGQEG